jgi:hypothetical protein
MDVRNPGLGSLGLPLTFFTVGRINATFGINANQLTLVGLEIPNLVLASNIMFQVANNDAVNLYDIGLYTAAGVLVADIGARSLPGAGSQSFAFVQGAVTFTPGRYLFGFTGNANTEQINFDNQTLGWFFSQTYAATVGGALPATIAPPTLNVVPNQACFALF